MMTQAATNPDDKTGLINLHRSRTIYNYVVGGLSLAQEIKVAAASDWRELGIRFVYMMTSENTDSPHLRGWTELLPGNMSHTCSIS